MEAIPNTWQTWAVDPLSNALTLIHDAVGSYAIAIVLFTVLIRLLMIPLTLKQITSQRKMQLIQPELEKIRGRFKGDRQAVSEATMKLYKERGVNPMAGCLPIFIQLPVLLALYGGILTLSGRGLLNEQFLWFNLAREDSTIQVVGDAAPTVPVDVVIATTDLPTPLESSLAISFTQFAANYRFRTDVVDAEAAVAALNDGSAAAIFLDNETGLSQLPVGTDETRLVQAAAFLVERDRAATRMTVDQVEGILRGEIINWADLDAGVGPIVLHGLKDDLSAPRLLERVVLNGDPIAVPIREHNSVDDYFNALRAEPGSLGVSPPMRTDDIRMLNIEAPGDSRAYPALADVLADGRYALARDVYAYWAPATDSTKTYLRDWWNSGQGPGGGAGGGLYAAAGAIRPVRFRRVLHLGLGVAGRGVPAGAGAHDAVEHRDRAGGDDEPGDAVHADHRGGVCVDVSGGAGAVLGDFQHHCHHSAILHDRDGKTAFRPTGRWRAT